MAATSSSSGEAPYGGTAAAVPGTVQAANYDTGGQGVAYNVTSVNGTGNGYRPDGVDLEACTDTGCGDDLGWTATGQWFKYTVNVATAGSYTVSLRLASPSGVTDGLHIASSSGANLSGNINVPGDRESSGKAGLLHPAAPAHYRARPRQTANQSCESVHRPASTKPADSRERFRLARQEFVAALRVDGFALVKFDFELGDGHPDPLPKPAFQMHLHPGGCWFHSTQWVKLEDRSLRPVLG